MAHNKATRDPMPKQSGNLDFFCWEFCRKELGVNRIRDSGGQFSKYFKDNLIEVLTMRMNWSN